MNKVIKLNVLFCRQYSYSLSLLMNFIFINFLVDYTKNVKKKDLIFFNDLEHKYVQFVFEYVEKHGFINFDSELIEKSDETIKTCYLIYRSTLLLEKQTLFETTREFLNNVLNFDINIVKIDDQFAFFIEDFKSKN